MQRYFFAIEKKRVVYFEIIGNENVAAEKGKHCKVLEVKKIEDTTLLCWS